MADISALQARAFLTQAQIDNYRERPKVMSFLRSFFPTVLSSTRYVSIEVQRGSEKVAVDVARGSDGNRNTISKSTEKIFDPAYYREFLDATELRIYDRLFSANGIISGDDFAGFVSELNDGLMLLQDKIERAYELQCAQVLETGIVELHNGDNIDFKRKAASLVDLGAGNYWTTGSVDPKEALKTAGQFLRKIGKAQGGNFNVILGADVLNALYNNDTYKEQADIRRMELSEARAPQRNAIGADLHGKISAGSYNFNLWGYDEYYNRASDNALTSYVDPKKIIVLPDSPQFKMAFAAVPRLLSANGGVTNVKGDYVFGDYPDEDKATHKFDIKSAGVAVPTAIDQIWTGQVIA